MKNLIFTLLLVFAFVLMSNAQVAWTPEMQVKTKAVASVQVSPDGKRVAYTVSDAVMNADRSEYVSQIWMANADGSNAMQITFGEKSSTNPQWSPDGNFLAFTSNRKDNKNNLYILRLAGGEAEPLTDTKTGVSNFDWSPDGRFIAFTMSDKKTEEEEKNDKARNDFHFVDENQKMSRLYVVAMAKDANGKREPRLLTSGNFNVDGDFDWSPDNRTIAFSHTKSSSANDWTTADVSTVDVASGQIKPFLKTPAAENSPRYSPDGKSIAILVSENPPHWAGNNLINIFSVSGGEPKILAASFDTQPTVAGWSPDGKRIYFTEGKGTGTRVYAADVAANKFIELNETTEVLSGVSLNRAGTMLGFVKQNADTPPEAFVSKIDKYAPIQISRVNNEPHPPIGKTEIIRWKSADGKEIEGLLTYPVGYQTGTKVPLILNIHGGPTGVFTQSYIGGRGVYPLATFAQKGYAILRANPRGSSGYGREFRYANVKDWGGADYQDLMSGVDKVIEMGVADPERLGVMGWSYGGFMTSWIVTQTHRFKAASAGAPVTNLMSFNGTADIPSFVPDYFGGQFWEAPEIYMKHSAMFNVKGVTTPTLIEQGDADVRVPISQGYEFYNALKAQGVPVRMLVLPRQPHGPTEPKMQVAAMQANLDWFEKYLGNSSAQK